MLVGELGCASGRRMLSRVRRAGFARGVGVALSVAALSGVAACGSGRSPSVSVTHSQASPTIPRVGTSAGVGSGQTVPGDLVGRRLDLAVRELQSVGLGDLYDPPIPGHEADRDWGVCSTMPSAEQSVNGPVVLHIGHFICGGGSNSNVATDATTAANDVKVAWHQVTEALARGDSKAACADLTAGARRGFVTDGSSCQAVVMTMLSPFLSPGDVQSVASAVVTGVTIHGDRATVNYFLTNGLQDLDAAVGIFDPLLDLSGSSVMQRVGGKWLLAANPN
jgi:hypothetical protein